ncbi:MAG: transcriptional regulator, partial [Actinocrinis sp.]
MGWWQVNADTLAGGRFVISPIAEACACHVALHYGRAANPGERAWLDKHSTAYRERLARDPITALLVRSAFAPHYIADFFLPAPDPKRELDIDEGLAQVRATPPELAKANLAETVQAELPVALDRPDLAERAADLLEWVWTHTVLPDWPRRRRVMEADIVARTRQLTLGGWAAALGDMRTDMHWLGDGRLQINGYDLPPREISGAQLMFVPVTLGRGCVTWTEPHAYAVVYPCSGPMADNGSSAPKEAPEA